MSRLLSLLSLLAHASALDNGLILTPPMGWSSWNKFHCGITETLARDVADALVSSGLRDAGYTHLNLDDCAPPPGFHTTSLLPHWARVVSPQAGWTRHARRTASCREI